jgi:hypothetical protein
MAGAVNGGPLGAAPKLPVVLALTLGLAGASVWALGPLAPFTPPPAAAQSASAAEGGAPGGAAAGKTAAGFSGVRLAQGGAQALIDGQWWPLGSAPRGALLVAVRRHEARLRHADGHVETLTLHPAATPAPTRPSTPATPATGSTR